MKNYLLVLIFLFAGSASFAQFKQGRVMVGGAFGFNAATSKTKANSTTTTNYHEVDFSLTPQVGYFVINNLAVGAGVDMSVTSQKDDGSSAKDTYTSAQIQPFVRYYLPMKLFFQGTFGVGSAKDKFRSANNNTTEYKYNLSSWSLGAGYAWFLNDNVALEPQVGFQSTHSKDKTANSVDIDGGLYVKVGFQIYLR